MTARLRILLGVATLLVLLSLPSLMQPEAAPASAGGAVYGWGANLAGNLGNGSTATASTPVQATFPAGVAIQTIAAGGVATTARGAAGPAVSLAVDTNGSVWSWGGNADGQLGNGTTTGSSTPVQVDCGAATGANCSGGYLTGISAIASGGGTALAVTSGGAVFSWGNGAEGTLGDGAVTNSSTPVQVVCGVATGANCDASGHLAGISSVSTGAQFSLALASSGAVYAWGFDDGALGDGGTVASTSTPLQAICGAATGANCSGGYLTGITAVSAGSGFGLALTSSGAVFSFGSGVAGTLGDGSTALAFAPVQVVCGAATGANCSGGYLAGITSIAAGNTHALAAAGNGAVYAWGTNGTGALGTGVNSAFITSTPVQAICGAATGANCDAGGHLAGITAVAAGNSYSLALSGGGAVYAWGTNGGQFGNGTTTPPSGSPVQASISGVSAIAAGSDYGLALVAAPPAPAPQAISFTSSPPSPTVFGGSYTPSATATSGLAVTFTIDGSSTSGACAINGSGVVSFTGTGTCVVDANQAGSATYAVAPQVEQSFQIGPASQSISFTSTAPTNAVYGGSYTPTATAASGLPVSFSIGPSTANICSLSNGVVSFIGVGICTVAADQAGDADYLPAQRVTQSFNVGQASQSISFTSTPPANATAGGSYTPSAPSGGSGNPVSLSIDGSSTAGACTVNGSGVVSFAGAGTCVIDANEAGNVDYADAPQVQQSFTIAALTPQAISFDSTPPSPAVFGGSYTVSVTGGNSGIPVTFSLDSSSTAGACSVSGAAVHFTGVGSCVVDANQAGSAGFAAAPQVTQTIAVTAATQTISFSTTPPSPALIGGSYNVIAGGGGSGNPVTFSAGPSSSGVCTVSGATVSFTGAGSCIIDANQAGNADYLPAVQAQQSITVTNVLTPVPLTAQQLPVTSTATVALTPSLGGFSDPNTAAAATAFTTMVNWGDGTAATAGTVSGANGNLNVSGTHTYALDGSYQIGVSVSGDGTPAITLTATANVGEPAGWIAVSGATLAGSTLVEGSPLSAVTVATFTDKGAVTSASGYSATINWGDGTAATSGTVTTANGSFSVSGSHTYAADGKYTTSIQVAKVGVAGATGNGGGSVTVADADKLSGTPVAALSATAGTALSNVTLGTFSDSYTAATAAGLTASISWGDGTAATAGTVSGSAGSFSVTRSHTYATKGAYSITVTLSAQEPASDPTLPVAGVTATDSVTVLAAGGSSACNGSDLSYCNLTGQTLTGRNLQGVNLTGANLAGVSLSGTNLSGANLTGANLTGANLQGGNLQNATLSNANLQGANLQGVNLQGATAENADLAGANLKGDNLQGGDLKGANLSGADLQGDNLQGDNLSGANLSNANLSGANLQNANATGANLQGANLQGANTHGMIT